MGENGIVGAGGGADLEGLLCLTDLLEDVANFGTTFPGV